MPIKIPSDLPAATALEQENIFVMPQERALSQDIRPLRILLLNLMPKKIETETQILRLLSNSPLQIDVELLQTASHTSRNTSANHMLKFYKTIDQIESLYFDGMIVTGAPVEHMEFSQIDYWEELSYILSWARSHVFSTFHICWGAIAALNVYYQIPRRLLDQKKCLGCLSTMSFYRPTLLSVDLTKPFLSHTRDIFISTNRIYANVVNLKF